MVNRQGKNNLKGYPVLLEVVLSVFTFGGGSAVTATKTALRPIFTLLAKVGSGAMKAITTLAAKLRKWISGAAKSLVAFLVKISRKIGSKVDGLLAQVRKWVDELEGGGRTRNLLSDSKLGTWNGKKILSETPTYGGHKLKILEDGSCLICSNCKTILQKYHGELRQEPSIRNELISLEAKLKFSPNSTGLLKRQRNLIAKLERLKTGNSPARTLLKKHETILKDARFNDLKDELVEISKLNPKSATAKAKTVQWQKKMELRLQLKKLDKASHHGHSFRDHGPHVTDSQHRRRLRFGTKPDGSPGNPPSLGKSSSFLSDENHLRAFEIAWDDLQQTIQTNPNLSVVRNRLSNSNTVGLGKIFTLNSSTSLLNPPLVSQGIFYKFTKDSFGNWHLNTLYGE